MKFNKSTILSLVLFIPTSLAIFQLLFSIVDWMVNGTFIYEWSAIGWGSLASAVLALIIFGLSYVFSMVHFYLQKIFNE